MQELENKGWAGVCPDSTECNVDNVYVTCGPASGRRKRRSGFKEFSENILARMVRTTHEIRTEFRIKTTVTSSTGMSPLESFSYFENVITNISRVIEDEANSGSFDVEGATIDPSSYAIGNSVPVCPEGTFIRLSSLTCGEILFSAHTLFFFFSWVSHCWYYSNTLSQKKKNTTRLCMHLSMLNLKLYCRYEYARPYMINRIWSLKQLWLQANGHAWIHLHGLCWPVRNGDGAKNSKWKYVYPARFEPTPSQSTTGKSAPKTARPRWLDIKWSIYSLTVFWNGYVIIPL